jgi:2,4-dienoyl-CoA reductase-like NADH-dependent reductase (Old Yellow Enzyme family)
MSDLLKPLDFPRGQSMKNRFMLAPLTNCQSDDDGTLSEEEYRWLTMRAEGGFGLTMTCAAHVQQIGQGFPGQLGIWKDGHLDGLTRLASAIKSNDSVAIAQIHHAGMRSPGDVIGATPVCPSDNEKSGARGLSLDETKQLRDDFVEAAVRAEKAGFDGVEIHGAHGYILCQYFSSKINVREDEYGGDVNGRYRILFEIIDGIRARCGKHFMVGVRLSPERFGMQLSEVLEVAQRLMVEAKIDFLDMSLWDSFKEPEEDAHKGKSLMQHFVELERGNVRLGVAGNIRTPGQAEQAMNAGVDWIMLGRAAMLNHNFPLLYQADQTFTPAAIPASKEHLAEEGLSPKFIEYFGTNWPEFVAE